MSGRYRYLLFGLAIMSSVSFAAEPVARISVLTSGQLFLNGKPVTLTTLDKSLAELKSQNGVVWYYRENAQAEPSPEAMQAIQLVAKHKLPISMSTKADFSDYVDANNGFSRPRKP